MKDCSRCKCASCTDDNWAEEEMLEVYGSEDAYRKALPPLREAEEQLKTPMFIRAALNLPVMHGPIPDPLEPS